MSFAVLGSNQSIKISGGAKTLTRTSSGSVTYTVPANSYFILSAINLDGSTGSSTIRITSAVGIVQDLAFNVNYPGGIFLGPGQTIQYTTSVIGTSNCYLIGVEFTNSP